MGGGAGVRGRAAMAQFAMPRGPVVSGRGWRILVQANQLERSELEEIPRLGGRGVGPRMVAPRPSPGGGVDGARQGTPEVVRPHSAHGGARGGPRRRGGRGAWAWLSFRHGRRSGCRRELQARHRAGRRGDRRCRRRNGRRAGLGRPPGYELGQAQHDGGAQDESQSSHPVVHRPRRRRAQSRPERPEDRALACAPLRRLFAPAFRTRPGALARDCIVGQRRRRGVRIPERDHGPGRGKDGLRRGQRHGARPRARKREHRGFGHLWRVQVVVAAGAETPPACVLPAAPLAPAQLRGLWRAGIACALPAEVGLALERTGLRHATCRFAAERPGEALLHPKRSRPLNLSTTWPPLWFPRLPAPADTEGQARPEMAN